MIRVQLNMLIDGIDNAQKLANWLSRQTRDHSLCSIAAWLERNKIAFDPLHAGVFIHDANFGHVNQGQTFRLKDKPKSKWLRTQPCLPTDVAKSATAKNAVCLEPFSDAGTFAWINNNEEVFDVQGTAEVA